MNDIFKLRRTAIILIVSLTVSSLLFFILHQKTITHYNYPVQSNRNAFESLKELRIFTPHDNEYKRDFFGNGWGEIGGCDTRNVILFRDLKNVNTNGECEITSGTLEDPYTGNYIEFIRGKNTSSKVQIDHVVALSDAWIKGADKMDQSTRVSFANDPLELLAVSGEANLEKSNSDASMWLPPNISYRCEYIARQIAIKIKYGIGVSIKEKSSMQNVLTGCKEQKLPND